MADVVPSDQFELPPVSTKDLLLGSGPRFARDAFGPVLAFYVAWKPFGLLAGIAASTVVSMLAYRHERRHDRPGLMARISLGIVLVQAVIGVLSESERGYLAQPVLITGVYGLAFVVSAVIGRPLAGAFAREMYPFPDEVRRSHTFRQAFGRVSLAWGAYLLIRSVVRLLTLTSSSVEAFVVVNFATGVPLTAVLMGWSIWYSVRFFRRSDEWGAAIAMLDELQAAPAPPEPTTSTGPVGPPATTTSA